MIHSFSLKISCAQLLDIELNYALYGFLSKGAWKLLGQRVVNEYHCWYLQHWILVKDIRYWNWIFRNAFALMTDLLVLFIRFTTNWRVQVSTTLLDFPSRWILILEWHTKMLIFTFIDPTCDLVHSYFRNAYRWYFHNSILDRTYWVGN